MPICVCNLLFNNQLNSTFEILGFFKCTESKCTLKDSGTQFCKVSRRYLNDRKRTSRGECGGIIIYSDETKIWEGSEKNSTTPWGNKFNDLLKVIPWEMLMAILKHRQNYFIFICKCTCTFPFIFFPPSFLKVTICIKHIFVDHFSGHLSKFLLPPSWSPTLCTM